MCGLKLWKTTMDLTNHICPLERETYFLLWIALILIFGLASSLARLGVFPNPVFLFLSLYLRRHLLLLLLLLFRLIYPLLLQYFLSLLSLLLVLMILISLFPKAILSRF